MALISYPLLLMLVSIYAKVEFLVAKYCKLLAYFHMLSYFTFYKIKVLAGDRSFFVTRGANKANEKHGCCFSTEP